MDTMSDGSVEGRILAHRQILGALVAEQVYRALTMLTGHPYHRA